MNPGIPIQDISSRKKILIFSPLLVAVFLILYSIPAHAQKLHFYNIPGTTYNPWFLAGDTTVKHIDTISSFQISKQITLGEYKQYLQQIKKDSSEKYYCSLFPDTSMCSAEAYRQYMNDPQYEKYPVLGVSWDNAMNYCKWRTLKENKKGNIRFIYRLPLWSEWLVTYDYLEKKKMENDFNKEYADWTLNSFDDGAYSFDRKNIPFDYLYFGIVTDYPVLLRKRIQGCNYLFSSYKADHYSFFYNFYPVNHQGYAFNGYRYVSFRITTEIVTDNDNMQLKRGQAKNIPALKKGGLSTPSMVLRSWGIFENGKTK